MLYGIDDLGQLIDARPAKEAAEASADKQRRSRAAALRVSRYSGVVGGERSERRNE